MPYIRRLFVEKKQGCDIEAQKLLNDIKTNMGIQLTNLRILNRYDVLGLSSETYEDAKNHILSEPPVDNIYEEDFPKDALSKIFAIEFLPGQYDQRADWAAQCIALISKNETIKLQCAKVYMLYGNITDDEFESIKSYCINPVDSRETALEKPDTLETEEVTPADVEILKGFTNLSEAELTKFVKENGLAMSSKDLIFVADYFRNEEKRDPSITEIKVIDTYWSDHCRHTTFMTEIKEVEIEEGSYHDLLKGAFEEYKNLRASLYINRNKPMCLMDIATIAVKKLKSKGLLKDLDESEEINACSINIDVDVNGKIEKWLLMFKNETHNHPTEIEPFGGAATCLGGAIRDPLSGRSYVYQAMRVTGSGDPRMKLKDTLSGKLPQRKITIKAAEGYSSYGNQIGLATGYVKEIYHPGYMAKRMEVGAVMGAAPKENVIREVPEAGDIVILVGGRTGRDGCGGATGSSKEHTKESILKCGAEVQKGNAPTERKLQRLFRNPEVSKLIKRCNDFGAGGVSVAVGELADGLSIDLDSVKKKYEGLDGTELAISESQERMAVVIKKEDEKEFLNYIEKENIEAVRVAEVTSDNRLKMLWRGKVIVDISRDFLNTNGVRQSIDVKIKNPSTSDCYFEKLSKVKNVKAKWLDMLKDLNVCSQRGLIEMFDSTIGRGTVLMPFGGKYQGTPTEGMAAKIPVLNGETTTGSIMAQGFNPYLSEWSPFHGALYSVIEAVTKIVAMGGDYKKVRLSLQEYFERLGENPEKWGKPFAALLGALYVQNRLQIPAIGGKDSMSGSFEELNVPPTVVTFAVDTININKVVSPEFKQAGSTVIVTNVEVNENHVPDFDSLTSSFEAVKELINKGYVASAHTVTAGGVAESISKMTFGNKIGFKFSEDIDVNIESIFAPQYGTIVLEIKNYEEAEPLLKKLSCKLLGYTVNENKIILPECEIDIEEAAAAFEKPLEQTFDANCNNSHRGSLNTPYYITEKKAKGSSIASPRVFIPVFPGTNCEYDTASAFEAAGGKTESFVFKNLNEQAIESSVASIVKGLKNSQILMLSGGFSASDEPDGSGKFITAVFRNPKIMEALNDFIEVRKGLILGICNGFQALIKLGLVPYGEIRDLTESSPTLTYNSIGHHVSTIARTKVVSNLSPWFNSIKAGDEFMIPVSHGEGRFVAKDEVIKELFAKGQVCTQYVDTLGNPAIDMPYNPNGSYYAIEGITSPDGRILGKMGHSERITKGTLINIPGEKDQKLFESGINYFK